MPSSIRRWSPNLLPRLPSSDGINDSTAAQNSSEITPIRVTGQSSLVNAFPFGRHALADGQSQPNWIRQQRERIDVTAVEEDGFWCWAVVETLRHTGIRIEELIELTQLSLRHYTASTTGTLVPLLHIVPSKTDCERLVPMTPELVQVLLAVLRRAKGGNDHVPLSVRYDVTEKVHGEPFPHLFARKVGTRQEVLSGHYLRGSSPTWQ